MTCEEINTQVVLKEFFMRIKEGGKENEINTCFNGNKSFPFYECYFDLYDFLKNVGPMKQDGNITLPSHFFIA